MFNVNTNQTYTPYKSNLSFGAIPIAQYAVDALKGAKRELTVYKAEPKDIPIIDHTLKRLTSLNLITPDKGFVHYVAHGVILKKALLEAKTLLEMQAKGADNLANKAKIFIGVAEKQPVGIAITHTPKHTPAGELTYSSRAHQNETELDWLSTFPLPSHEKVNGAGKILLSHVYETAQSLPGFNRLYVRSERANHSFATKFYKSMGFQEAGSPIPMEGRGRPVEISHNKTDKPYTGLIDPLEITTHDAAKKAETVFKQFNRQDLSQTSSAPEKIVDFNVTDDKIKGVLPQLKKFASIIYEILP